MYAAGATSIVSGAGALALTGGAHLMVIPFGVLLILIGLLLVRSGQMSRERARRGLAITSELGVLGPLHRQPFMPDRAAGRAPARN